MRHKIVVPILAAILSTNSISGAEPIKRFDEKNGYGYEFNDDPLNANGFSSHDLTIYVRKSATKIMLIRPRSSFIIEMLRSIEEI